MQLFDDTDEFFRRRRTNPSHTGPLLIVGSIVLLSFIQHMIIEIAVVSQMYYGGLITLIGPRALLVHIYVLARPFVIWGMFAVAFHVLSGFFGGTGPFRRTLILTGWGFLPQIPTKLLAVVSTWIVVNRVPVPGWQTFDAYRYLIQLQSHPLMEIPTAVGLFITLWALPDLIWVYAVKHARNLDRREAIITATIPVGISILLTANSLLNSI